MKVLVLGGAGFIGSHLVDRLLKDGHEVMVVDISEENAARNLSQHLGNHNLRFECMDVQNIVKKMDQTPLSFIDASWSIVHLAALADIVPSIEEPLKYHETNVNGTIQALELARRVNVKKFIYAASASCYGDKPPVPTKETDPINPKYPYALTKYIGEQYVQHYHRLYKLPTASLRLFNVYGPRARTTGAYGAVFGVFLAQKLNGKPFTIVGGGSQSRDFVYVSDVVEAITRTLESQNSGEIYNIGSGGHSSITTLVNLIGGNQKVHLPDRPGEPQITMAWIAKAQQDLRWSPAVSLPEGVRIMLDNIQYWKDAPVWEKASIEKATEKWFKAFGENK